MGDPSWQSSSQSPVCVDEQLSYRMISAAHLDKAFQRTLTIDQTAPPTPPPQEVIPAVKPRFFMNHCVGNV
jgi:hypothetical protein